MKHFKTSFLIRPRNRWNLKLITSQSSEGFLSDYAKSSQPITSAVIFRKYTFRQLNMKKMLYYVIKLPYHYTSGSEYDSDSLQFYILIHLKSHL